MAKMFIKSKRSVDYLRDDFLFHIVNVCSTEDEIAEKAAILRCIRRKL